MRARTYLPIGAGNGNNNTGAGVFDSMGSIATLLSYVFMLAILGTIIVGIVFLAGYRNEQSAQSLRLTNVDSSLNAQIAKEAGDVAILEAADVTLNTTLCAKILMVNDSIREELAIIGAALNLTSNAGQTFMDFITGVINNATAVLQTQIDDSLSTVNGVHGAPGSRNLALVDSGIGHITVTNSPGTHSVSLGLGPTVAASIVEGMSPAGGLAINLTSANTYTLTNLGILTLSGVGPQHMTGGNVFLTGTGMIDVVPQPNTSTVVVDGSQIVAVLSSLQTMDLTQQAEITALNNSVTMLQMQMLAIQQAEMMISQSLNGTVISFNMSLTYLFETVMMLQMQVAALEAQLANFSSTATPTGSIMPWSGSDGGMIPSGYLLCDGSVFNIASYMNLFGVIGMMYCPGQVPCLVGEFAVPDMRGRVPVGKKSTGVFNTVIGTVVGAETKSLDAFELPMHNHATISTPTAGEHEHIIQLGGGAGQTGIYCDYDGIAAGCGGPGSSAWMHTNGNAPNSVSHPDGAHGHPISMSGSNQAFNIAQPSLVMQFIIKT
jgi:microcystin-dependent protein